jgi:hypothetical protein
LPSKGLDVINWSVQSSVYTNQRENVMSHSTKSISNQKSNQSLRSWSLTTCRQLMASYGKKPEVLLSHRRASIRPVALAYPGDAIIVWHGRGIAEKDGAFQAVWHADGSVSWNKKKFANLTLATRALVHKFDGMLGDSKKVLPANPRAARYWAIPVYDAWFSDRHTCIRADLTLEEWVNFYDAVRPCVPPTAVLWEVGKMDDDDEEGVVLETRLSWGLKVGPAPVFYAEDPEVTSIEGSEAGYVPVSSMIKAGLVNSRKPLLKAVTEDGITMSTLLKCMEQNRRGILCCPTDM